MTQPYTSPGMAEAIEKHTGDKEHESSSEGEQLEAVETPDTFSSRDHHGRSRQIDYTELNRIASTFSQRRTTSARRPDQSALERVNTVAPDDPSLDPSSDKFDLPRWLKHSMRQMGGDSGVMRTGVAFKNLSVSGSGNALQLQATVGDIFTAPLRLGQAFKRSGKQHKRILNSFDGVLNSGELLIVLGRPGSGCSTFLKTITGELQGLNVEESSEIHYNGIPLKTMRKEFKGHTIYNQEVDVHFPHLTVGQTLEFAAAVRTPSTRPSGTSRNEWANHSASVAMAVFGLSHTRNTKVGNDFIRGVSGGERKRVSIAEMVLAGSPFCAWDNSTRGLDAASALTFVQALRNASDLGGSANAVAIYQASQAIYDLFDKATVLYEGRQIYYGSAVHAKSFFEKQGWYCPPRQTSSDFLTSVTNPSERVARKGMENMVPRTPEDFERYWRNSPQYRALLRNIDSHEEDYPKNESDEALATLRKQKNEMQAKHMRPKSPYTVSIPMQIRLNTKRAYQRIWGDKSATLTQFVSNSIVALIVGSIYYGQPDGTQAFGGKAAVLFLAVLINALTAVSEINSLYDQRPIIEKHNSYAFYHPATEAAAGLVADIPVKFVSAVCFNIVLYFMAGLRREAAQFFLYFLITYLITFVMAAVFRTMAALTKTISQALSLSGILILVLVIYTGFVIAPPQMHPWFAWLRWCNPVFYAFEILVANEFHGRDFTCSARIPAYSPSVGNSWICSAVGAVAGQATVSGDAYILASYTYSYSHVWRNFGVLIAFLIFFTAIYLVAVELNSATSNTAEVLVFQRGHVPASLQDTDKANDEEKAAASTRTASSESDDVKAIVPQTDIFTWTNVTYDVETKDGTRRLLDNISGWVKPGTLTALMGVSGAGKTTLLDVLAQRKDVGVVTGSMFVNGNALDASFQRKTGYVQQQDLHLETSTVRESLRFSAFLRQPKSVSKEEKYQYVEDVIDMLGMRDFANAVVGVPGQGLNVEQRKLLTIGVELAAKPKLLLFLDEPTSGLDSQSSWRICAFLRKLADSNQAVLCTIHQPSAILFQAFDRLLFLAKGGKTVYFGKIGDNSQILLEYFQNNGGRRCGDEENPAEYMLEVVNKVQNEHGQNWNDVWLQSPEQREVEAEIKRIHTERKGKAAAGDEEEGGHDEFAMSFFAQYKAVQIRVFQQYWRIPDYIMAKAMLAITAGLFIGFTFFQANGNLAGMQNILFSIFMVTTLFSTLVNQIQPHFITQRALYEVRERPSKAYSWKAFLISIILVEIPFQIFAGILVWACYYFPVVGIQSSASQVTVMLFAIVLLIFASTFAHASIAALPDAQTASALVVLIMMFSILFCGVLQTPSALPGFWTFMYRVSPFTYWIAGIAATELHGRVITCSASEASVFDPPSGQTCGQYLATFLQTAPGTLENPNATSACQYCQISNGDQFLASVNIYYSERWRNFGLMFVYIFFNIFIAVATYYLFRIRKYSKSSGGKKAKKTAKKGDEKNAAWFYSNGR